MMVERKLSEFQMKEIESFWDWIKENKENVDLQYIDENRFYLYLPFDCDMLNEFTNKFQYFCEEGGLPCEITTTDIVITVDDIEGGYGFTMTDLWENRPDGIENELGENLY